MIINLTQSILGWMKFVQINDQMGRFALAKLSAGFAYACRLFVDE